VVFWVWRIASWHSFTDSESWKKQVPSAIKKKIGKLWVRKMALIPNVVGFQEKGAICRQE
jgi:ribosomal protein S19